MLLYDILCFEIYIYIQCMIATIIDTQILIIFMFEALKPKIKQKQKRRNILSKQ